MKPTYFDYAATTPLDPIVVAAMLPYFTDTFYNPSAQYGAARTVKAAVNEARATIAHYIGCRPSELIFTAGGTEANNLAIQGVLDAHPGYEAIVSAVEHDSIRITALARGAKEAPVSPDGRVDILALEKMISDKTVVISVQYVNNEIGVIQPLKDISRLIEAVRRDRRDRRVGTPLYFHTDACQAGNYLDLHVSRLGVDMMTINASKIYGPKQMGALFVKSDIRLVPQILGGGQERGQRSGTENVPAIIGFAKALQLVQDRRHDESQRITGLQSRLIAVLTEKLPTVQVNGSMRHRIANNVHVTFPGCDNETLMMQLDAKDIICAVGSACSASNEEPSHVLKAIGLSDEAAQASLRFTLGRHTTEDDIARLVDELVMLIG